MEIGEQFTFRWVVLIMASTVVGMTMGITMAVGLFYSSWLAYFDAPASYISITSNFAICVACFGAPLYRYVIHKLGFRWASFAGGLIMSMGYSLSYFAESVLVLCLTYGTLGGIGAGICNLSACGILNEYFHKQRSLAEGFVGSAVFMSMFLFSLLQHYLIELYTWKGAILLCGAICLHLSVASLFFIPAAVVKDHPLNLWGGPPHIYIEDGKNNEIYILHNHHVVVPTVPVTKTWKSHFLIWKDPKFLFLLTVDSFHWMAQTTPYLFMMDRGRLEGIDDLTSSWLSSSIGLGGIVGRPLIGSICDHFKINPMSAFSFLNIASGLLAIISPWWTSTAGLFTFAISFGFLSGSYCFLKASTPRLLGPKKFVEAMSWLLMLESLSVTLGSLLGGAIYDATRSYGWSFRVAGLFLVLTGALCVIRTFVVRCKRQRKPTVTN